MVNRLSTFSSEKLPLALCLAVVMVMVADSWVLGVNGPWESILQQIPHAGAVSGVARGRLAVRAIQDRPPDQLGVFVVGSSRAQAGFFAEHASPATRKKMELAKIAHPGLGPFGVRSAADEMVESGPDAVVVVASEFDTHRPIRIVPQMTFGSASAIRDLLAETGFEAFLAQRDTLYQLAMTCLLKSYRYRDVLAASLLNKFRRFELDERFPRRLGAKPQPLTMERVLTDQEEEHRDKRYREMLKRFPDSSVHHVGKFRQVDSITRGGHALVQGGLLRRAVHRLSEAGIQVLIAEAPLHPIASEIYDSTVRAEFLAMVASLEDEFGIRFLSLEDSGPYEPGDFGDLTHLNIQGSAKFSRAIIHSLHEVFALEPPAPKP